LHGADVAHRSAFAHLLAAQVCHVLLEELAHLAQRGLQGHYVGAALPQDALPQLRYVLTHGGGRQPRDLRSPSGSVTKAKLPSVIHWDECRQCTF
jgi:hypothetical protein